MLGASMRKNQAISETKNRRQRFKKMASQENDIIPMSKNN
jgi:hypothetical protein